MHCKIYSKLICTACLITYTKWASRPDKKICHKYLKLVFIVSVAAETAEWPHLQAQQRKVRFALRLDGSGSPTKRTTDKRSKLPSAQVLLPHQGEFLQEPWAKASRNCTARLGWCWFFNRTFCACEVESRTHMDWRLKVVVWLDDYWIVLNWTLRSKEGTGHSFKRKRPSALVCLSYQRLLQDVRQEVFAEVPGVFCDSMLLL